VGPRAGLDRCEKSCTHRDSISGPSNPYPVAIPTTLPGPLSDLNSLNIFRVIKSRRMRWEGHVGRMGRGEAYTVFKGET